MAYSEHRWEYMRRYRAAHRDQIRAYNAAWMALTIYKSISMHYNKDAVKKSIEEVIKALGKDSK